MTIFTNDPIRIRITLNDLLNLTHKKGIDSCAYQSEEDIKNEFFIQFISSDIDPFNPDEEKYRDDIDREIEKLTVVQDHIREFYPNRLFNSQNNMTKECVLDPKVFGKENKYDILLDKATDVHRLKNGQLFGTIEK